MRKIKLFHVYGEFNEIKNFLVFKGFRERITVETEDYVCVTVFIGNDARVFWASNDSFINEEIEASIVTELFPIPITFESFVKELEKEGENENEILKDFFVNSPLLPYSQRIAWENRVLECKGEMKPFIKRGLTIDIILN